MIGKKQSWIIGLAAIFMAANPAFAQKLILKKAEFSDLPGWQDDRQGEALAAFSRSCGRILLNEPEKPFHASGLGGKYGDWQAACRALDGLDSSDHKAVRDYFTAHFKPWRMVAGKKNKPGKCTAYFEKRFKASREKTDVFKIPVHGKPPAEGQWTRKQIMSGDWPHADTAFLYVETVFDLIALQTEGSGVAELPDGSAIRLEYAGKNGRPYSYIGEALVGRGIMKRKDITSSRVRGWIEANPDKADEIIHSNQSYVFMREMPMDGGPLGAEGLVLTPGRSIAVDDGKLPYSTPIWLDTATSARPDAAPIRRLVVAQDRGEGIKGPKRCDYFAGGGPEAAQLGGSMTAPMEGWVLLPKELKP